MHLKPGGSARIWFGGVAISATAVARVSQKSLRAQTFKAQLGRTLATVHSVQCSTTGEPEGKIRSADVKF